MKGGDVSFVISAGLGDPVVGLVRGAQCDERPLCSIVFLQEPAASWVLHLQPKEGCFGPRFVFLSSKGGIKNHLGSLSPWVAVLWC